MGPPRFERESEDPQSPRIPGYPTAPCSINIGSPLFIKLRFCRPENSQPFSFCPWRILYDGREDQRRGRDQDADRVRDMESVHKRRVIQIGERNDPAGR